VTITILAAGSRGDTQPYLALGLALKQKGCNVRLATFKNYETFIKRHGIDFYPIRGDVSQVVSSEHGEEAAKADNPLRVLLSFNKLKTLIVELQKDFYDACTGSDTIIYHPGMSIGYFAAQRLKVPSILATPFPMSPTRDFPALVFYNAPRLGRTYNLMTHRIFERIMWQASGSAVKDFWKKEFGHAPKDFACPYGKQVTRLQPTIISCSNHVFPRPADWPEGVYSTGYWFLDEEAGWTPSDELIRFLDKGEPPVYIGFGSLGGATEAKQTMKMIVESLRRCGQRGILATGWSGMTNMDKPPDDIFILESAPHAWLFPRMKAVVHHGGAGTTAAGLRAGVPSIVIPHGNDTPAWGRRVYELGVGPKPVPRKKLSLEKLSKAITSALTDDILIKARELGLKIQAEKGAEVAARVIINALAP
jgi:sterol 3beta-glucosyltransferase